MTPELWARLKPLYQAAMQQPLEHRAQFISDACGDDDELKRELAAAVNNCDDTTASGDFRVLQLDHLFTRTSNPFSVGELVLGRFKIVRRLGSGGMGEVYEASDLELGRIALKTIHSDIADDREALSRFKKEVNLARRVADPNVCRVHELFVLPATGPRARTLFLTMEFLDGITLADKISESGPLPWPDARKLGLEICSGLQAIHQCGIIHRDLKSRNVMLTTRGGSTCAVLMDFGLARELKSPVADGTAASMTGPGTLAGTPAYMAPEQFEGAELSRATDIYALGIILYEIVTGKHPFVAATPVGAAVLRGRRPQRVSSIRAGVPHHIDALISKCLEYEPGQRYQSAAEVAEALKANPLSAGILVARERGLFRRRGVLAIVGAALTIGAIAVVLWLQLHRYRPPTAEAQHWYEIGTAALREGTYVKATRALQVAVDQDKSFALGHARLAEAWSELDFDARAQKEMVLASVPESEESLPRLDRMYIEAIRSTLTHDFAGAVNEYRAILRALPENEKAVGWVDLGRAQEKAANPIEAVKDYETASHVDKDNPAAFVRLGILRNKLEDASEGEAAFKQAAVLYAETSNTEGLAEIAYQRGYAANVRGDSTQAKENLETCLQIAQQIPSVQLQIRALTQMSSVEYVDGKIDQAIGYANQAIKLARDNNLEYWSSDGLVRLGNAYVSNQEPDKAEPPLQEALHIAEEESEKRLEANAKVSLASVRSQQEKWDESIQMAQAALNYYKSVGLVAQATNASLLIIRAERNKNELSAALSSATEILEIAKKSGNQVLIETAEEQTGDVLESLERYPEALSHFEESLQIARAIHSNEAYEAIHCASVLQYLGHYGDAENRIAEAGSGKAANRLIVSASEVVKADILFSQGHFAEVKAAANRAFNPKLSSVTTDDLPDFRLLRARAEVNLGEVGEATSDLTELADWARQPENTDDAYRMKLVQAEIYRKQGSPQRAQSLIETALTYFSNERKRDSEWRCLLEKARVERDLGKIEESKISAQHALDILTDFHDTWPPDHYDSYIRRRDNLAAQKELASYAH